MRRFLAGANSIKNFALMLAVVAAASLAVTASQAASTRTWVSNTGTNNAQCSVTSPCQTFAQALAATQSGGDINCLTPGDFAPVEITISVTIDCEAVSNGGISATTYGAAVVLVDTAAVVVNLIGLEINSPIANTGFGVKITAPATVNIRNCKIYGFQDAGNGAGIFFEPNAPGGILVVDNVFITNTTYGIYEQAISGNMTVRNSDISNSEVGIAVYLNGGTHTGATIEQTTLAFNDYGIYVADLGDVALIGDSTVVNNSYGVYVTGGVAYSFGNNQIGGNSTDISGTLTPYPGGLN